MNWDVFKKPGVEGKKGPAPTPYTPKPGVQPGPQPKVRSQALDLGQDVDFASMSEDAKQCWHYACTNYKGNVDPVKWAQYWSQLKGLPYDELLHAATVIHNITRKYNVNTVDDIPPEERQNYPWWDQAVAYDPASQTNSVADMWQPSQSMLDGISRW